MSKDTVDRFRKSASDYEERVSTQRGVRQLIVAVVLRMSRQSFCQATSDVDMPRGEARWCAVARPERETQRGWWQDRMLI